MSSIKKTAIVVVGIFILQIATAQSHNNTWFRGTLSIPIDEKFKTDHEFQHRRQNGFDNRNLLDQNLLFSYRAWIHYQFNQRIKVSLSPFAFFSNYKIIQKPADVTAQPVGEIRFSAAFEWLHQFTPKWLLIDRTILEYRMFNNYQSDIVRLRNRLGLQYNLTPKLNLSLFDEPFVNLSGVEEAHFFDQNRIGLNFQFQALPHLKFDMGYMYVERLPLTNTTELGENTIFLNLTYLWSKASKPARLAN